MNNKDVDGILMRKFREAVIDPDMATHDHEASMARGQLYHIAKDAMTLIQRIKKCETANQKNNQLTKNN
jgi:hypothetical protein